MGTLIVAELLHIGTILFYCLTVLPDVLALPHILQNPKVKQRSYSRNETSVLLSEREFENKGVLPIQMSNLYMLLELAV